jgi:hypothetical protein
MSLQSCSMKVFNKCGEEMCTFSMQHIPCKMIELIGICFPSVRKSIKHVVGMQNLCSSAYIFRLCRRYLDCCSLAALIQLLALFHIECNLEERDQRLSFGLIDGLMVRK